jgi:hypothetical protein
MVTGVGWWGRGGRTSQATLGLAIRIAILTGAHAYIPSYSGGRDQEDHGSKSAWASSSQELNLENT